MEYTCEMFMDYAYEGEVKIPLHVRMQNALTKLITAIRKFILKVRSLKTEHEVPRSVLDAYKSLSKMCFNCVNKCKNALQTGDSPKVVFNEPFDTKEYKILFDDNYKKKASPGDYVKISSSEVLGNMNGALTALSSAKQGLRSVNGSDSPNQAAALTQIVNYTKFMLKISNRVLSYRNMYVEKRHLPTTPVNEAYIDCITEIDVAIEGIFGNLFKKKGSSSDMVELTAIEEVHPENPLYDQFVTISINYDPRNLFTSNKSIPNNIPKEIQNFYKQCEPENVCVSMNGNNLMFIPLREINRIQKTYPNVSKGGRFIFATVNADPVYYYDGKICTTYHSDSKLKDEMISSSFNDFLKKLILENGTKKNW